MKPTKDKWEDEFDKKFTVSDFSSSSDIKYVLGKTSEEIKTFIRSLIAKERQEERERIIRIGEDMIAGCTRKKCFKDHEAIKTYIKNIKDL